MDARAKALEYFRQAAKHKEQIYRASLRACSSEIQSLVDGCFALAYFCACCKAFEIDCTYCHECKATSCT